MRDIRGARVGQGRWRHQAGTASALAAEAANGKPFRRKADRPRQADEVEAFEDTFGGDLPAAPPEPKMGMQNEKATSPTNIPYGGRATIKQQQESTSMTRRAKCARRRRAAQECRGANGDGGTTVRSTEALQAGDRLFQAVRWMRGCGAFSEKQGLVIIG